MYRILESTPERLTVKVGDFLFSTTYAFDNKTGAAEFRRRRFGIPSSLIVVPISEILALVPLVMHDPEHHACMIVLLLRSGKRRWLAGDDPETTSRAARQIAEFTGVPPQALMPWTSYFNAGKVWFFCLLGALMIIGGMVLIGFVVLD